MLLTIKNEVDLAYAKIIKDVLENGKWDKDQDVRPKWEDGTPAYTKSILNARLKFDGDTVPILTQKRVGVKDPIKEILWIWQQKSNIVQELRDTGCKVWNDWEKEDGTIGLAYGWQLGNKYRMVKDSKELAEMIESGYLSEKAKRSYDYTVNKNNASYTFLDQVDYLLFYLKTDKHSRRIKTTLWETEDLDHMALEPCVYDTHWQTWDDKLNLTVNIRSNDMALGNPYNIYQYTVLQRMIAQVAGMSVGEICFNIDNAHVYERHVDGLEDQMSRDMHKQPELKINPYIKSFYDFTISDVVLTNYNHSGDIKYEIAI